MYYVDTALTGQITLKGQVPVFVCRLDFQCRHVPPGKILQLGGNSNGSVVIDITNGQPR
jgi:hypothetical protein